MNYLNDYEEIDYIDYILSLPSGEVIDMKYSDIMKFKKNNLIEFSNQLNKFFCDDVNAEIIRSIINRIKFKKFKIENFLLSIGLSKDHFKIYNDLSVDVYTSVNLTYKKLYKIPFKFNKVTSNFDCSFNELITLENSPTIVHGYFNCSFNNLKNLEGGPKFVSKHYNCSNNKLISLKGSPEEVNFFNCSNNKLENLYYAPVTKNLSYFNNPIDDD